MKKILVAVGFVVGCGAAADHPEVRYVPVQVACLQAENMIIERQGTTEEQDVGDMQILRRTCNVLLCLAEGDSPCPF